MNAYLERLDAFHAEVLGCPLAEVEPGEIRVVASERRWRREEGYGVIFPFWLLVTRSRGVISVRPELEEPVRAIVRGATDAAALFGEEYAATLEAACRAVLSADEAQKLFRSHSLNFYADAVHFRSFTVPGCRRLTPDDQELIDEMSRVSAFWCTEECVRFGAAFGVITDGKLVARSTTIWTPETTDQYGLVWVGVETLPAYRRRGYAKAVVSETTETLLARGLTPAYDCAVTNLASANTAQAVGYQLHAETLHWRYREDET
jgi:GNAT superfamily N-acetyltransferase